MSEPRGPQGEPPETIRSVFLYRPSRVVGEPGLAVGGYIETRWLEAQRQDDDSYILREISTHVRETLYSRLFSLFAEQGRQARAIDRQGVPLLQALLDIGTYNQEAVAKVASGEYQGMVDDLNQLPVQPSLPLIAARKMRDGWRYLRRAGIEPH